MNSTLVAQAFAKTLLGRMQALAEAAALEPPPEALMSGLLGRLWQAALDGDVCINMNPQEQGALRHPACQPLIGKHLPLMTESGHLYLGRFWHAEQRISETLRRRADHPSRFASEALLARAMADSEANLKGLDPVQRQAVQAGLQFRLSILHGGPGTGKTRTIASLIACHARTWRQAVWVAAPTARAGARLMESLQTALDSFDLDDKALSCLPTEAMTIQRLLGRLPPVGEQGVDALAGPDAPVSSPGLVIVDEASMLSLEMCDRLFAALDEDCALMLVGDPNQLHSVETGAVFAALCEARHPGLQKGRVHLARNFRQADHPALGELADAVLAGTIGPALFGDEMPLLAPDVRSLAAQAATKYLKLLQMARQKTKGGDLRARARGFLNASAAYRLISARRTGFAGADQLSEAILVQLRRQLAEGQGAWFEGRLITVTRNDYGAGLFNGDIGVYLDGQVAFGRQGDLLLLRPGSLPEHQDAYCMSVHQSQGSEFDEIDFIAAPARHALATRELLYTAVTRARSRLRIFGAMDDLVWAAAHPTRRLSRLSEKIQGSDTA